MFLYFFFSLNPYCLSIGNSSGNIRTPIPKQYNLHLYYISRFIVFLLVIT